MDATAIFKLTYGLFITTACKDGIDNGCITNTTIQATSDPTQVVFAINKDNKTTDMIKETKKCNFSILTENTPFEIFKHFGMQSGKNVDKFKDFKDVKRGKNGVLYINKYTNAYISCDITNSMDIGSHMLFVAKVTDMEILSDEPSVTYQYYQDNIKPKVKKSTKKTGKVKWVCRICGYVYDHEEIPDDFICPWCKHGRSDFEKVVE